MNTCTILFNQTLTDLFLVYPIICYHQKNYDRILLYINKNIYSTAMQLFMKFDNIILSTEDIPTSFEGPVINAGYSKDYDNTFKGILDCCKCNNTECHNLLWNEYYSLANVPIDFKVKLLRNITRESETYNKFTKVYGTRYIFSSQNVNIYSLLPIYTIYSNYYKEFHRNKYLWIRLLSPSDNILDYLKIIENATEIHITDDVYFSLCPYLNLEKVKVKCLYTLFNLEGQDQWKDWNIVQINKKQKQLLKPTFSTNRVFKAMKRNRK
jgi:hypothetical protein